MPRVNLPKKRTLREELASLEKLLGLITPVPEEWLSTNREPEQVDLTHCISYRKLVVSWRKALKWTDGLDCSLSVMLAASASTCLLGEQLWFKVIGPPASGKTTILEGLSVNKEYVYSKDSIRGLYQGWKDKDGQDLSLAALANRKTLAIKDGDTLLKSPNLAQILSELRGLYDGAGRTHYRNTVMHNYEGHRMTLLLCGTASLREIDESELGARCLDCVVMDTIDDEFENDVAWRAVNQEAKAMLTESNGDPDNHHPPALTNAMKMTGGYLSYLRGNIVELLSGLDCSQSALKQCANYGKFVAYLRARPTRDRKDTEATREFSARLAKQHIRLAQVLAVTLNCKKLDGEPLRRTRKIALDTSRGKTLDIVETLYTVGSKGRPVKSLCVSANQSQSECRRLLKFLERIGAVETFDVEKQSGKYWKLTPMLRKLYKEVVIGV